MSFSDTAYIPVYDKPDERDGLWGQVYALLSEES